MDLDTELQKIYDSEINISISWLWDDGIVVRLGDTINGYLAERKRFTCDNCGQTVRIEPPRKQ